MAVLDVVFVGVSNNIYAAKPRLFFGYDIRGGKTRIIVYDTADGISESYPFWWTPPEYYACLDYRQKFLKTNGG